MGYGGAIAVKVLSKKVTVCDCIFIPCRGLQRDNRDNGYGAAMHLDCTTVDVHRCCGEKCPAYRMRSFLHMGREIRDPNRYATDCSATHVGPVAIQRTRKAGRSRVILRASPCYGSILHGVPQILLLQSECSTSSSVRLLIVPSTGFVCLWSPAIVVTRHSTLPS
jgi:hypothetical protein